MLFAEAIVIPQAFVYIILGGGNKNKNDTSTTSATAYTVTKETGLYDSLSVDADQITTLSAGTRIEPADKEVL